MSHSGSGVHLTIPAVAADPLASFTAAAGEACSHFCCHNGLSKQSSWFPRDKEGGYIEVPDPVWQPSSFLHIIYSPSRLQRVFSPAYFRTLAVLRVCLMEECYGKGDSPTSMG